MNIGNEDSIKYNLLVVIKESLKFALIALIFFLIVGIPTVFILLLLRIDTEIAIILSGILTSILIVIVDELKVHASNKILNCNRRIIKILKNYVIDDRI